MMDPFLSISSVFSFSLKLRLIRMQTNDAADPIYIMHYYPTSGYITVIAKVIENDATTVLLIITEYTYAPYFGPNVEHTGTGNNE